MNSPILRFLSKDKTESIVACHSLKTHISIVILLRIANISPIQMSAPASIVMTSMLAHLK